MSGTSLFTVVLDFRGGTFVSQHEAKTADGAVRSWVEVLRREKFIPKDSVRLAAAVARNMRPDEPPVLLDGLTGAWCYTSLYAGQLVLLNIIRTAR